MYPEKGFQRGLWRTRRNRNPRRKAPRKEGISNQDPPGNLQLPITAPKQGKTKGKLSGKVFKGKL